MNTVNQDYLAVLRKELKPVMGCTEPATAALVGSLVRQLLGTKPTHIVIHASRDVIKNVMHVGIPHSTCTGLAAAVLLGVLYGDPQHGLNVLSCMEHISEQELQLFTEEGRVTVSVATGVPSLYVQVSAKTPHDTASVTIGGEHDRILQKTKNGEILYQDQCAIGAEEGELDLVRRWSIADIIHFVTSCNPDDVHFLIDMAHINHRIAEHGLKSTYGLSVGRRTLSRPQRAIATVDDAFSYAAALSASASDARMAGCTLPVVINSGSGNQGVTTMLPPLVVAHFLHANKATLARALALSNLVAIHLARYKGRLSALCGAFTAAIGASCAFVYLLGGNAQQIEHAVQIMLANLTGVVCDGAKKTCALKIYSCVDSAAMSAKLALTGGSLEQSVGIVGNTTSASIANMERLCHQGLQATDRTIVSIMVGHSG